MFQLCQCKYVSVSMVPGLCAAKEDSSGIFFFSLSCAVCAAFKEVMVRALISFMEMFKSNSLSRTCLTSTAIRESSPRLPRLLSLLKQPVSLIPRERKTAEVLLCFWQLGKYLRQHNSFRIFC